MLMNVAHLAGPSFLRDMETASRAEKAQSAAWSQLARDRGNLQFVKDELFKLNRGRLLQCVSDQQVEYVGRKKGGAS